MPDFAYTARDMTGSKVTGSISAATEREVITMLSGKSLFPIEVSEEKKRTGISFGRRVKGQTMAIVYSQMAGLLRAGVPLLRTLNVLREQASHQGLKDALSDVSSRVEDGETLADAMQRHPNAFGEMAVNMVRAGGEGGFMEEALERVAAFTEQQEDLKSRTMGALAYPIFLGTVGSLIVAGLIIFVVPNFDSMFDTMRSQGQLPVATEWLLAVSTTLQSYWYIIVIAMLILLVMLQARAKTDSGRRFTDLCKLKLPLFGVVFKNFAVARFCRVLGTLLRNGVPILGSLEIAGEAAGNKILSEAIESASENITAGESLAKPLASSGHFPQTVVEMISVAEESNSLDTVLVEIADSLEKRTTRTLDLAVKLLEPVMLLVMAGIVLFVVIALLLPMMKMSDTFS